MKPITPKGKQPKKKPNGPNKGGGIDLSAQVGKSKADLKNETKARPTPIKGASPKLPKKPWLGFKMGGGNWWPEKNNVGTSSTRPRVTGEHPKNLTPKK